MTIQRLDRMLLIVAIACAAVATARWRDAAPASARPPAPVFRPLAPRIRPDTARLRAAAEQTVLGDVFRVSNEPATLRYDPATDGITPASPPLPPPRPHLVLKGIVGGPPWRAILDGLPGQLPGTVAEQGSVFETLVVRSVNRDSVVIQGRDTLWVLDLRKRS